MSAVAEVTLLTGRTLRRFVRTPPAVVSAFAFPLLLLLVQLALFDRLVTDVDDRPYVERITPLVALSTAAFGASVTAIGIFGDLTGGFIDRLRAMGVRLSAVLAGRVVGDVLRVLATSSLIVAVAHLFGFRFDEGVVAVAGFFAVAALFAVLCSAMAVLAAAGARSQESLAAAVGLPATLMFFLSSGFVPVASFPGALQPVVRANPLSAAVDALIGLSSGGPVADGLLQLLLWTAAALVLFAVVSARRMRPSR